VYEFCAVDNQCVSIILISYNVLAELASSAVSLYLKKMVRCSLMCELTMFACVPTDRGVQHLVHP
jgi:hypothetical protein